DEGCLGEVHPGGEPLHLLGGPPAAVQDDSHRVPAVRLGREDIDVLDRPAHGVTVGQEIRLRRPPASITVFRPSRPDRAATHGPSDYAPPCPPSPEELTVPVTPPPSTPEGPDPTLAAEQAYLRRAREHLNRMRQHTLSLTAQAGDAVSQAYLEAALY